jgi:sulfatase maturation enzyme AslB (radical SAM superfamily)
MRLQSLGFVLDASCNLHCAYCYRQGRSRSAMPWHVLRRRMHGLLPACAADVECAFTGGEPLLSLPLLRRAVDEGERLAAKIGRRIRWKLLTNGLLLDRAALDFLDAHRFTLHVSFDGIAASQDARGRGSFPRLDALLDRLPAEYPDLWEDRLQVSMTLTPDNLPHLGDSVRYFLHKDVRNLSVSPAMGRAGCAWRPERIAELDRQIGEVAAVSRRVVQRSGISPVALFRKTDEAGPSPFPDWLCLAYQMRSLTVDVDGRCYGCVLASSSYRTVARHPLGPAVAALDVGPVGSAGLARRRPIVARAIRASGVFQHSARRASTYRRCADCQHLGHCQVCPIAAATEPGWSDPRRVPDFLCAFNQVVLTHRATFPSQPDPGGRWR